MFMKKLGGAFIGAAVGIVAGSAVLMVTPQPDAECQAKIVESKQQMDDLKALGDKATQQQHDTFSASGAEVAKCASGMLTGIWVAAFLPLVGAGAGVVVAGRKPKTPTPGV